MPDLPMTVRPTWFVRTLRALRLISDDAADFEKGAEWGTGLAPAKPYDQLHALSAMGAFPWVYAAACLIGSDLAQLPMKVYRGPQDDPKTKSVPDHPFLKLWRNPCSGAPRELFERQLFTFWALSGNAYILQLGLGPRVESLKLLHPNRTSPISGSDGSPQAFEYDGLGGDPKRYHPDAVEHVRGVSWLDDDRDCYGQGWIQALELELQADLAAAQSAAKAASKGRPDWLVTPAEDGDRWSDDQVEKVRAKLTQLLDRMGGVAVIGGASKAEQLSWSMRDLEYLNLRTWARDTVLAVAGIPPSRVGVPAANYATARQQEVSYWTNRIGDAALLDAFLSPIAQRMSGNALDRVSHDFSRVPALQYDRGERLDRVFKWVMLGADPNEAATYELFEGAPHMDLSRSQLGNGQNAASIAAGWPAPLPDGLPSSAGESQNEGQGQGSGLSLKILNNGE